MIVLALLLLLLLAWLPFGAALAELVAEPGSLLAVAFSPRVLGLLGSSVALGVAVALASALIGVPVGRALARSKGWQAALTAALLPLPLVLPPWMTGVAVTRWLPLRGFWGATLLLTLSLWPIVAFFALRGFRAAARPSTAARVLGASRPSAALRVELPLALPSILSGALLVFVFSMTDFAAVDYLSFQDPQPFVVLASEIFQRWARLESSGHAAAVSLAAVLPTLLALLGVLAIESRHAGHGRGLGSTPEPPTALRGAGRLGLLLTVALLAGPALVLLRWAALSQAPGEALDAARESAGVSLGVSLAAALIVAVGGVLVARATLVARGRLGTLLLGAALLPLAAPGVMFAVGQIRVWNHPANPLSDLVYPSNALLVITLAGRFLPMGVLAGRALLVRLDPSPFVAARLTGRPAWRVFLSVDLPMLAPAATLAATLGYLLSMRELDMVVLVPAGSGTLAHRIFSMVHIASDDVTAVLCLLLLALATVPALALRLLWPSPSGGRPLRSRAGAGMIDGPRS